jgi:hypothetical protein
MWNYEKVRNKLIRDHKEIYADLEQMESKMRSEPQRFQYQGFIGKQNGALCVVVMLVDSDALTSPIILRHRLDDMEQNFDEYCENFTKYDGVSVSDFREGYLEKLNEVRNIVRGAVVYFDKAGAHMAGHGLSKSRITAWLQCPRRLWLKVHVNKNDLPEDSAELKMLYREGNAIGDVARQLCPDGVLIDRDNGLTANLSETQAALKACPNSPIFEATFQHDGLLVQVDALLPTPDGYRMSEVKSSSEVKPYHIDDCAIQVWVLKQNKIKLASVELAYIDKSFVYAGDGNYHGLLKYERLDKEVKKLQSQVPIWIKGARTTLSRGEPKIKPGVQCSDPHKCEFIDYCYEAAGFAPDPKYPLDVFNGMMATKKAALLEMGYEDARKVPAEYLNAKHLMIQRACKSGKAYLDQQTAKAEIDALPYPRYYIDFESVSPKLPRWAGTQSGSPNVPFQWSCHVESAPGQIRHEMFLDVSGDDPRRKFAGSLIKVVKKRGPVLVYNASFEKARIRELADRYVDLARALHRINERVVDLMKVAQSHYYHPDMMGSWSLKAVLPTLVPDVSYVGQAVANGGEAQLAYLEIIDPETTEARRQERTEALREYCKLDTYAMVLIAWFFEGRKVKGMTNAK